RRDRVVTTKALVKGFFLVAHRVLLQSLGWSGTQRSYHERPPLGSLCLFPFNFARQQKPMPKPGQQRERRFRSPRPRGGGSMATLSVKTLCATFVLSSILIPAATSRCFWARGTAPSRHREPSGRELHRRPLRRVVSIAMVLWTWPS